MGDAISTLVDRCRPAQVELLTGMADGADQLVTDVAIGLGCKVHLVLPKPADLYRAELSDAGAARLHELTASGGVAASTVVDGRDPVSSESDPALPYHRLGLYLGRSAHVLIALWDGEFERKPGGTLDVLTYYLDRRYQPESSTSVPDPIEISDGSIDVVGPTAIWIETRRAGGRAASNVGAEGTKFLVSSGLPGAWRSYETMPASLGEMLDDLSGVAIAARGYAESDPGYPLLDEIPDEIDPSRRLALDEIHKAYSAADLLAVVNQTRSDRAFIGASLIAAAMAFAFLWFAKIDDHLAWLYGYLVLFMVGYALFRTARSKKWLRSHLSLRVLAETLRVRFFTALLGIEDRVDVRRVLARTGVSSFPGFAWAREADRIGVPLADGLPSVLAAQSDLVQVKWVDDQAAYFDRKVHQLEARHERLEVVQRVLYILSFLAVVAIITYGGELKTVYAPGHVSTKTILIFLMGLVPLWLTLWELHQGRMATRELLWQFRNQAAIFGRASAQLGAVRRRSQAPDLCGACRTIAVRDLPVDHSPLPPRVLPTVGWVMAP